MNLSSDITGGYINHEFVTEYYDYIFSDLDDIDFYINLAKKADGPVLELASGSGRLLIPIAKAGVSITGIDLSDKMLDICMDKLKSESDDVKKCVEIIKADIRDFTLNRKFPLVLLPFSTFQYLTELDDQVACLKSVVRHLEDGGTFVLSVFNESISRLSDETLYNEFDITSEFSMEDGRKVSRKFRYVERDYTKQVETKESIFLITHPDGKKERLVHKFDMRYFFQFELIHLCERIGLKVKGVYSDYHYKPFDASFREGRMVLICGKQE